MFERMQWRSWCDDRCWLGMVLVMLLSMGATNGSAAVLVENGQPRATIVLEEGVPSVTRQAVNELVHYVQQISGAELPVVRSGQPVQTPTTIWVGRQHADLERHFPDVELDLTQYEEIVLAARGNHVLIVGRDGHVSGPTLQRGTSQAVYAFIEQQLGVRWLWPGELGTEVPNQATIELEPFVFQQAPPLKQRYLRLISYQAELDGYRGNRDDAAEVTEALHDEARDWRRRHRADRRWVSAGHAFTDWWDRFGQSNPEYFALQPDGRRTPHPRPSFAKMCISNPGLIDRWTEEASRGLENNAYQLVVTASPNDSGYAGYCVCDDCQAWDASRGPKVTLRWANHREEHVALTDRYARWWNILAERISERHPGREVYVGAWAYGAYRTPPVEVKLADNIIIGFIGASPDTDAARHREDRQIWKDWADMVGNMVWRPNLFYYDMAMPVLFMQRSAEQFAWLTDHKMMGLDIDTLYGHWSLQGLQYYMLAKLSWDPYLNADELIDDYMTNAFGAEAGPIMRQYFETLEKAHYQVQERFKGVAAHDRVPHFSKVYTSQLMDRLGHLLEQARSVATEQRHQDRVAFFRVGHDFTRSHLKTIDAMTALQTSTGNIDRLHTRAVEISAERDRILDEQLDDHTLNSSWIMTNLTRNVVLRSRLGPPDENARR